MKDADRRDTAASPGETSSFVPRMGLLIVIARRPQVPSRCCPIDWGYYLETRSVPFGGGTYCLSCLSVWCDSVP